MVAVLEICKRNALQDREIFNTAPLLWRSPSACSSPHEIKAANRYAKTQEYQQDEWALNGEVKWEMDF